MHERNVFVTAGSDGRLRCLDGLRGVLATYVMTSHLLPLAALPAGLSFLRGLFAHGQAAVDVFFILSGLVIVRSLASHGGGARFLRARWWRTFPVYLAVLALAVPIQALPTGLDRMPWASPEAAEQLGGPWPDNAWARVAAHLTMTHGLFPDAVLPDVWVGFLGAAWSLSTEWQFYLVVAALGGARRGVWGRACLLLALAAAGAAWQAHAPDGWRFSRAFLPNKAEYFALGMASAGLLSGAGGARLRYGCVLAAALALSGAGGQPEKLLPPLAWTLCLAAQMGWAPLRPLARLLTARPLLWLGAASYGLYLANQPLQRLLALALLPWTQDRPWLFDAIWLPGAAGLPILAAWWLHQRVELPCIRLGRGGAAVAPSLSAG